MHWRNYVIITCLALLLFGCNAKQQIKGRHYLDIQNYKKGIASFEDAVRKNPDDPAANYYLGRFYLVEKENKKASDQNRKERIGDSGDTKAKQNEQ